MKSGNLNFLEPSGPLQACNGTALTLYRPVTGCRFRGSCPDISKWFSLLQNHSDVPEAHAASYSMATRILSPGLKRSAREMATYLHIVPKLRMNGVITLFPPTSSWRKQGKLHFFFNYLRFWIVHKQFEATSTSYEGWNFNSGNYLFTTDTK